jgi:hypothetical protein
MNHNYNGLRAWLPVVLVALGIFAGYIKWQTVVDERNDRLSEAVSANSAAIEKLSVAMERMTDLMINDARHDAELVDLRRDLEVVWDSLNLHRSEQHPHDDHDTGD